MRRKSTRIVLLTTLVIAAAALAARIALPGWIQRAVNRELARGEAYTGRVGEVDVALWRGLYAIEDVEISKRNSGVPVPFLRVPRVDFSVEWRALLHASVVGEVEFSAPELNFVNGPTRAARQTGVGEDWRAKLESLIPLRIDRLAVRDGRVHYRDFSSDPEVDVYLDAVQLEARNLTNGRRDLEGSRVASVSLRAVPMHAGRIVADASIDPFATSPSFDLDLTVRGADLTQWNDYLRAYAGLDVQRGYFALYAELLAGEGRFDGYVKPFVEDLDVLDFRQEEHEQGLLASLWEAIAGAGAEIVEDQPHDRQAAKVPISGSVEDPDVAFWPALGSALRNAFLESLPPGLERSIGSD